MRRAVPLILLTYLAIVVVSHLAGMGSRRGDRASAGLAAAEEPPKDPAKPPLPPLKVTSDAPLLLGAPAAAKPGETAKPKADNFACYVCHANYEDEPMVVSHAKEDVGCVKCHGESIAHRNDEDNVTPPDIMYPQEAIDKACAECHDTHDAPAVKIVIRWQERCPGKEDPSQIVCTDCHGEHRLKSRTVRWDKKTGRLLARGEQRGFTAPHDAGKKGDSASQQGFEEMR